VSDFKEIIQKIGNTMKTQESRLLARSIQSNLYRNIRRGNSKVIDFGVKPAPFLVLLGVDSPSVLTEVSCLSDAKEEQKLRQESYRTKISNYLAEGIVKYLDKNDNLMTQ
jgi:N-acetylmuramoyl-L-alanine amidase